MRTARNISLMLFLLFFILAVVGGLFIANMNFVKHVPGGTELIVPWKAMQNFMLQGVTPYGDLTKLNIQTSIYNQPILPGQYPYRVNTPLFLLVLFLPFAWIQDFTLARVIWLIFLELGLMGVVLLSLRLSHWKPHWLFFIFILLFGFFWQPTVTMFVTASPIILQALVLLAALRALELGSDELAGALAALSLLNIEATGLVFLVLIIWIFSTQRWRVLAGIGMTLTILIGLSFLLLPSWLLPFIGAVMENWRSGALPSTFATLQQWLPGIGNRLAQILAVAALTIGLLEWRAVRRQDVRWLFWTSCLTAALAPLFGIPYTPAWLAFTLPGVLLVASVMTQRWGILGLVTAIIVMAGIFLGLWAAQLNGLTSVFILFYPLSLTLLLYWVRWGAVRPPRLWADEIKLRG